jgi:PAS domain S-box-containing protein
MQTIYVSPAFEKLFGMSIESAYERPGAWLDVVHPEDRHRMETTARSAVTSGEAFRVVHPDGAVRWIRSRAFPAHGPSGALDRLVGFAEDVTELRNAEIQLRHAQKMEAIGRLAGGVAHDFNNLLTAILGFGHLALQSLRPDDPLRHNLEQITKAGSRAASLTRQLLAFSRQQVLTPRVLSVQQLVRDLEKMLQRVLGEDVKLGVVLALDELRVKADATQLDQVIVNLAVNARDAMPEGGTLTFEAKALAFDQPLVSAQATIPPGHYVVIAVSDTGVGMNEEVQRHIFEPFFTTKGQGKGTGLGLATVHGIIQQSGGFITVYSEPGHGTTFRIYLPRVDAPAEAPLSATPSDVPSGNETIMLVEDEEAVRALARMALELAGYRVLLAANGAEALRLFEGSPDPIHLVLTDVIMPEMGGPALIERLRALRPTLRVLYMSGYTDRAVVGSIGQGEFLEKPYTPDVLAHKVRQVLDQVERPELRPGSASGGADAERAAA